MSKTFRQLVERRTSIRPTNMADELCESPATIDSNSHCIESIADHSIVAHIYRIQNDQLIGEECQLLNLSPTGVKLVCPSRIEIGESVGIRIQSHELSIDFGEGACVCWTGHHDDGETVGLEMAREIDPRIYQTIVESGILDRRRERRTQIALFARAIRNTTEKQMVDVRVDDYSSGGFGIFTQTPIGRGESLLMQLNCNNGTFVEVCAETRWRASTQFGYRLGCRFESERDFETFEKCVEATQKQEDSQQQPAKRSIAQWFAMVLGIQPR